MDTDKTPPDKQYIHDIGLRQRQRQIHMQAFHLHRLFPKSELVLNLDFSFPSPEIPKQSYTIWNATWMLQINAITHE
jgi:hypothetical protein